MPTKRSGEFMNYYVLFWVCLINNPHTSGMSCGTIENSDGLVTSVVVAGGKDGQGSNAANAQATDIVHIYIPDPRGAPKMGRWTSSGMRKDWTQHLLNIVNPKNIEY